MSTPFELPTEIEDRTVVRRTAKHLAERGVRLPRFAELASPDWDGALTERPPAEVDPDAADPANLARVHWYNDDDRRGRVRVPRHLELPPELTGCRARIVVALGNRFPLIGAHKVLAAYACLVPRLVSGRFDPTVHRAVWPSTGNYCRGGVAISRILGCRGVAVLPQGMSSERFDWLARWVEAEEDVIRTPGTESNVKEIYDACDELAREPDADIINQFSEFANYVGHHVCTGRALGALFESLAVGHGRIRLAAFVAATGSAGTLGAGDALKAEHGARIVAVEPIECPTMLYNGFGEHNIQGVGDKHIPLIHNTMNTDIVVGVSDRATDALGVVFNSDAGRAYLAERRRVPEAVVAGLGALGLSGIGNVLGAIKTARRLDLGPDDVVLTVATDGAELYRSERRKTEESAFRHRVDTVAVAETFGRHVLGLESDHLVELGHRDRLRLFNLGYYTWVEQRGVSVDDFNCRKDFAFWRGLAEHAAVWDEMIDEMNRMIADASATGGPTAARRSGRSAGAP